MRDARQSSAREVSHGVQRHVLHQTTWFGSTVMAQRGAAPLVFERLTAGFHPADHGRSQSRITALVHHLVEVGGPTAFAAPALAVGPLVLRLGDGLPDVGVCAGSGDYGGSCTPCRRRGDPGGCVDACRLHRRRRGGAVCRGAFPFPAHATASYVLRRHVGGATGGGVHARHGSVDATCRVGVGSDGPQDL